MTKVMTKVSIEDEISVFLNRIGAMLDTDHAESVASLFAENCSVFTTHTTACLKTRDMIQNWHVCVFSQLEMLKLNLQLINCRTSGAVILVDACFHFQFCYTEAADQLEAVTVRASFAIEKDENKSLKIAQMHCSLPVEHFRKDSRLLFTDPFADE